VLAELFNDQRKEARLCRKVKDPVAFGAVFGVDLVEEARQPLIPLVFMEFRFMVKQLVAERVPYVRNDGFIAGELIDGVEHLLAEVFVGFVPAGEADAGEVPGKLPFDGEVIKCRSEFACR
jgi:hypothetical protein